MSPSSRICVDLCEALFGRICFNGQLEQEEILVAGDFAMLKYVSLLCRAFPRIRLCTPFDLALDSPIEDVVNLVVNAVRSRVPRCVLIICGASDLCKYTKSHTVFDTSLDMHPIMDRYRNSIYKLVCAFRQECENNDIQTEPFLHVMLSDLEGTVQRATPRVDMVLPPQTQMRFSLQTLADSINDLQYNNVFCSLMSTIVPTRYLSTDPSVAMSYNHVNILYHKALFPNKKGPLTPIFTFTFIHYFNLPQFGNQHTIYDYWTRINDHEFTQGDLERISAFSKITIPNNDATVQSEARTQGVQHLSLVKRKRNKGPTHRLQSWSKNKLRKANKKRARKTFVF